MHVTIIITYDVCELDCLYVHKIDEIIRLNLCAQPSPSQHFSFFGKNLTCENQIMLKSPVNGLANNLSWHLGSLNSVIHFAYNV